MENAIDLYMESLLGKVIIIDGGELRRQGVEPL